MAGKRVGGNLLVMVTLVLVLGACAAPQVKLGPQNSLVYVAAGSDRAAELAPVFVVADPHHAFNRIGAPAVAENDRGEAVVSVAPDTPAIYTEKRKWQGRLGTYTNYIYRVHFREVPFSLLPFHLTAGRNVGLLTIVTVDERQRPVLVTTLHTCGCYLAMVPTSYLDQAAYPDDWDRAGQNVFGERLPGVLQYNPESRQKITVSLRSGVHRVMALTLHPLEGYSGPNLVEVPLLPMSALEQLEADTGGFRSLFVAAGERQGYVEGSFKPWERLLIGWWALDWRVGEDKKLGISKDDGPVFYTSLKPWARQASDLRDFGGFVAYWGWRL